MKVIHWMNTNIVNRRRTRWSVVEGDVFSTFSRRIYAIVLALSVCLSVRWHDNAHGYCPIKLMKLYDDNPRDHCSVKFEDERNRKYTLHAPQVT